MSFGVIYKVENKVNKKIYIGQTILQLNRRKHLHENCKNDWYFSRAIRKYGKNNFKWEIIEYCDSKEEMDAMEFHYIKQYNSFGDGGYNLTFGGDGVVGYRHTEEHKKRISNLFKGRTFSKETIEKMRESHKGYKHSEKSKIKMSLLRKGRKFTDEHRRKISQAHMGRIRGPVSEKTLENMSKAKKGKPNIKNRKKYVITFPNKNKYVVKGLNNFCKLYNENNNSNLWPTYLNKCVKNKIEDYKGFKCRYYDDVSDVSLTYWEVK